MKRILLLFSISIITSTQLCTQLVCTAHFDNETCTDIIPAETETVASTVSKQDLNNCFWQCSLSTLNLWAGSSNLNIDMENLTTLNLSGSEITIWAKTPATINLDSCVTVIIYYEEGVTINIDTSCVFVTTNMCASVVFDYISAPASGCFSAVDNEDDPVLSLYPNPAEKDLAISCGVFNDAIELIISDMHGKAIYHQQLFTDANGMLEMSLPGIPAGIYMVSIKDLAHEMLVVK